MARRPPARAKPPSDRRADAWSERPWKVEHVLGDVRQNEIRRDRRDLIQTRLPEFALDVELGGKAETAVGLEADVGSLPRRFRREILRHVCFGAAWLPRVE